MSVLNRPGTAFRDYQDKGRETALPSKHSRKFLQIKNNRTPTTDIPKVTYRPS